MFQASDTKGRNFLELLNNDSNIIELTYSKEGLWLKYFSHSNLLYTKASRVIINYTLIEEYHLRFFSQKEFACSRRQYPVETRFYS